METIRELAKGKRFNEKVYGKMDSYSIYLNNEKIEVTNEQASEYMDYLKEFTLVKENMPKVLHSSECTLIAIENGIERSMVEQSLEQMKAKIALFEVKSWEKTNPVNNITATLQIAYHKGQPISAYSENTVGASHFFSKPEDLAQILKQFE